MGLDSQLYKVDNEFINSLKKFEQLSLEDKHTYWQTHNKHKGTQEEIAYWRKHNALHNFMKQLWEEQSDEEFNCEYLELTAEDIQQLKKHVQEGTLKNIEGFFFGNQDYMQNGDYKKYFQQYDLEVIGIAEQALNEGWRILYDSSW